MAASDGVGDMHVLDPGIIVPNLIIGPLVLAGGILIVVFRKQLREWIVSSEKSALGDDRGNSLGLLQTPFWAGVTGVAIALLGAVMLMFGVVSFIQRLGGS
ncbi:hypothetical protein GCM10027406_13830 [Leifsonia lichenia]